MKIQMMELLAIFVVLLTSCAPAMHPMPQAAADAIRFEHWSTGIGSADTANSQQTLLYQLTLVNTASAAITVHSIDLIFNAEIGQRASAPDHVVTIDRTLPPSATYQVNGEVTFDSTGIAKTQITAWGPPITKITVKADYASSNGQVK
jgi:hypothetical protein